MYHRAGWSARLHTNLAQRESMREFPQELVDTVIESADLDIDSTWSRLSLVCRAWLPATRRHRFSYIDLKQVGSAGYTYDAARSRLFLQILDDTESCCTFPSFVTRLSIDGSSTRTREHPEVFRILSKLTALMSVGINVWSSELGIQPLQDWLSGLPHLTEFTLNRISFKFHRILLALLESFPPLTSLTITTSSWESEYQLECSKIENRNAMLRGLVIPLPQKPPIIPYSRCRSIQRLHLHCPREEFLEAFIAAKTTNCSRVHLEEIQVNETHSIGTFLRHLGETLEHLSISFSPISADELCRNVDLRFNPGLRSLQISNLGCPYYCIKGISYLKTLPSLLRQCVSPFLTDITISIFALGPLDIVNWADLDASLISTKVHSSRKITFFAPDLRVDQDDIRVRLLADIQSWLPQSTHCALFEIVVQPGAPPLEPVDDVDWW